jgi:hypothetical protein
MIDDDEPTPISVPPNSRINSEEDDLYYWLD